MKKLLFLFSFFSTFSYSQNYETFDKSNYFSIVSHKSSTLKKHSEKDEVHKKLSSSGYDVPNFSVNGYYLMEKAGINFLSDTLGNVLDIPTTIDKGDNNWELFYPSKKGTFYVPKGWSNGSESSVCKNFDLYDTKGKIIKSFRDSDVYFKFGVGRSFMQIFTNYGDFITVTKDNKKVGLLDESGNIYIEPLYDKIQHNGKYLFLIKNGKTSSENEVTIFDMVKKKNNLTTFENVKIVEFENNFVSNKVILKSNSKYGLYNLDTQKWIIQNTYDDLSFFTSNRSFNSGTKAAKHQEVIYKDIFLVQLENNKGVVDTSNKIVVPIEFKNIYFRGDSSLEVYNHEGTINIFGLPENKFLYNKFYSKKYDKPNTDIVGLKIGNYWELFNSKTNEVYFTFEDKIIEVSNSYEPMTYITFENKQSGIYSIENKKFIFKNCSIGNIEGTNRYFLLYDSVGAKRYVIRNNGEIHFLLEKKTGAFAFNKGKFLDYKNGDYKKIYKCYDNNGVEIDSKECTPLYGNQEK